MRAAFGVTFAVSLGSFGVALIVAARFPLLPVELYRAFTGTMDDPLAAAMALVLALFALGALTLTRGRLR
jgi:putative spermidine/putrescine transport system permease protein